MPDFRSAAAEFDRQADILELLLAAIDACARNVADVPTIVGGVTIPTIPRGGQNTMAAAAVVLLASHFEEYVRQQVEEYAKAIVDEYTHIEDALRKKLIDAYWRCGSNRLSRIRPGHDSDWAVGANGTLKGLIDYPVNGITNQFIARMISEHENNIRWDTISELLGRVGIRKLSNLLHRSVALKVVLNDPPLSRGY